MSKHLERDLERLKREILVMGALAEDAMRKALDALFQGRQDLASEVIRGDGDLDLKEVEVEEECLKILALHQPVAADLRFIVAVLKVNNDLERMGDLAQSIAERAQMIGKLTPMAPPATLHELADRVRMMVKRSLDALVRLDPHLGRSVCRDDDEVDDLHRTLFLAMQDAMMNDPKVVPNAVCIISVSRALERIADLATNIAEDVVFTVEGEVIRHRRGGGELGDVIPIQRGT